ncbi:MAG: hypothetical protein F8N15_09735 [Methanobacterium sp.]|nr:hypothetical protein [Methanobacterium sp.]
MRKLIFSIFTLILFTNTSHAEEMLGANTLSYLRPVPQIIISNSINKNGIHIRTLNIACQGNANLFAIPPDSSSKKNFLVCISPYPGQWGATNLPFPLYFPPGYTIVAEGDIQGISITYDLNTQI